MKNKEDILLFFRGRNIAKEAIDVIEDKDGTKENLDDYFINNRFSDSMLERLTDPDSVSSYDRKERFFEVEGLEQKMLKRARVNKVRNLAIVFSSAAAIIAVMVLILTQTNTTITATNSVAVISQVTVPTLILNDSLNITLDENKIVNEIAATNVVNGEIKYATVVVPSKYTYKFMLPDSSEVTLNANSELRYPVNFNEDVREVFLKGEGYFEVKKNVRPFSVKVSGVSVKVYGTRFNINSYDSEKIMTVLVSGSVGVNYCNEEVVLKPAQMATVNKMSKIILSDVRIERYLAWLNGEIINDNEPLAVFLNNVARWYNIEFEYSDNIGKINISAEINNNRPLEEVLRSIEIISGVKIIKVNENKYMIRE